MKQEKLDKFKIGDMVRVFFWWNPKGTIAEVTKIGKNHITIKYLDPGSGIPELITYNLTLMRKIEKKNHLTPFIIKEHNGIERAKRVIKDKK